MTHTSDTNAGHTDIRAGDWIDRYLPVAWRPYARLARLDRPIGTWLLLLPCWWSIALAAPAGGWPNLWLMLLFGVGAVVMRGAGCTINDILDRHLDGRVERTKIRPIPSGQVTVRQAIGFLVAQLVVGFLILIQLNLFAIALGAASLLLVGTYPLMKRVTWWPQAFLGLTFNWGALLGWAAVRGELGWQPLLLYVGGILWTLGYDTIYAHQDREDDAHVGIKSTALLFGNDSRRWVGGFYVGAFMFWLLALEPTGMFWGIMVPLLATGALMVMQVRGWDMNDPADSLATFKAARFVGMSLLVAIIVGIASLPSAPQGGDIYAPGGHHGIPRPYMQQQQMLKMAELTFVDFQR